MEPLIGGPTSPFRANAISAASSILPESQQPRELSEFSFYKAVNPADKALHSTYRRRKRSAEATKLKFLSFSEFPGPLSAKALSSPQRSLLIDIWGHLFRRCFDDSVKITAENVNDEVPRLFKEIGYPFPISKSAMLAPGTGHQWPHHLAALSWLCELLIYENEFFFQEEEIADFYGYGLRQKIRGFFDGVSVQGRGDVVGRLVASAYPQLGRDPQGLKASVLRQLHTMNAEAEAAQQQVQQQLQQRQQQLARVEGELRDNASLMESIEQLTKEADDLRASIAETKAEISHQFFPLWWLINRGCDRCCGGVQDGHAAAAAAERDLLLQQQKGVLAEVRQLEERIKAQGIDKAEVEQIRHDISRLREGLAHRTKEIESLNEAVQALIDQSVGAAGSLFLALQVNECISSMSQLAVSVKLPTAEAWNALPRMTPAAGGAAAAADRIAEAAAAAAACDVKRATNGIVS
ncbi:kinetochore protein NDC80 homolog [Cyclospora cayetanensis]|uniref:Kinetochore protein NDC80 n=1 Tax=Cyclospora cayetanensis TaxID=88456 RepID=A0A6P6RPJ9_9EIME|nr:kinetochore protein NDC80 homolog [Cyclospora cayetanensis]